MEQTIGERGAAQEFEEVHVAVSDMHMSAGSRARMGGRLPGRFGRLVRSAASFLFRGESHPVVSQTNILEDFPDDRPFADFVGEVMRLYAGRSGALRLKLLGDTFDPQAVFWGGALGGPPHEAAAVVKMKRIISGHRTAMDALARFVSRDSCFLDVFIGNHDMFLVWPRVRKRLIRRLTARHPEAAGRIRFIGPESGFREVSRGIAYDHGMNAEAANAVQSKIVIMRQRVRGRRGRLLNEPLSSYLSEALVYRLKLYHSWIGRLPDYVGLARNSAVHSLGWSAYAFWAAVRAYRRQASDSFGSLRRRIGLGEIWRAFRQAADNQGVDRYARRLLRRDRSLRAVVMGHSHRPRMEFGPHGTYVNTGTWGLMFRLERVNLPRSWRRFRRLESVWLKVRHFLVSGRSVRQQAGKLALWSAVLAASVSAAAGVPEVLWRFGGFRLPAAVVLSVAALSGILRIMTVRPRAVPEQHYTFFLARFRPGGVSDLQMLEYDVSSLSFRRPD